MPPSSARVHNNHSPSMSGAASSPSTARIKATSKNRGPNVIILSSAGKPIFVRYGKGSRSLDRQGNTLRTNINDTPRQSDDDKDEGEDDWATACGILQAIRANVLSFGVSDSGNPSHRLGDIQSVVAGRRLIVFLSTESLTFVAISDRSSSSGNEDNNEYIDSEAWLRLQLEYVYSQVIFTLTDQVQSIFQRSPNYDLRTMMGPNVNASIRNLLDRFDPVDSGHGSGCATFLTAGVDCVFPIPPEVRDSASRILIQACRSNLKKGQENDNSALFGLLMVGTRLVTLVQPSEPASQLHTSDLHLVLTFVGRQRGLLTNELWFPLCLPRFDSSGFLYAYSSCLDPNETGLSMVLISHQNNTEQFEFFRLAANNVRKQLGLPPVKTGILRFQGDLSSSAAVEADDLNKLDSANTSYSTYSVDTSRKPSHYDENAWKREEQDYFDEDNESLDGSMVGRIRAGGRRGLMEKQLSSTNYLQKSFADFAIMSPGNNHTNNVDEGALISALKVATSPEQQIENVNNYLQLAAAVHFVFRCDIYIGNRSETYASSASGGMLTQCFGPPMSFPFTDSSSQHHVWSIYHRLGMRLRLGSSSVETTMDALDMIKDAQRNDQFGVDARGVSRDCPMQCLLESPPNVHGVTYFKEGNDWLYVGLNGKYFELYATLPGTIQPRTGSAYCARLVRRLMEDERFLFLSNPMTWNS
mmetsp:Transcript_25412/g.53539  ORF Transcript_25412/g.53539 Transcript_25412/m.53539 type:complete len:698 (-) Transcript_25412:88-2181(-)|eukprot:CAMPEP_0171355188 /NCGR_PEP_ID=MMETSP0878-20121228/45090_1 /TAXON_ID=67004 /ORGANISM="Thalassiosira weissflogii, Strain CCMP1336" /LENGTH=697 /DNA_ID=CAMNT_0011861181 /DNA_START=37 /DNA_END=2130 /DNA_ORIENTATION=+